MHEENIDTIRKEAVRLTRFQIEILNEMKDEPGIIVEEQQGNKQTYDKITLPKVIEMLEEEAIKLNSLDMVLAIVGTMKAGKSTVINAIVGMEVLPNRNEPMTSLPTFIRHKKGQVEPRLFFEKKEALYPLKNFINEAIGKISEGDFDDRKADRGLTELISELKNDGSILKEEYQGAESIFKFLKIVNDLVRFSQEFDLNFPFENYCSIGNLPVIEVEFYHLRGEQGDQGSLTLLDTPGPNEAGQTHLKEMMSDQLLKASAVLAVMDYTQLKSEADEQVRSEITGIAELVRERLFVMVNKFDQKGNHDMKEEDVINYVHESLMDEKIKKENVFPVSARQAYLGNYVRCALQKDCSLPDVTTHGWVEDFYKIIDGTWEKGEPIEYGKDELLNRAKKLWKKSKFEEPLNVVIRNAHAQSSLLLLGAAVEKLWDGAKKIHNLIDVREGGLRVAAKNLQETLDAIKIDIDKTKTAESNAKNESEKIFGNVRERINSCFKGAEKNSLKSLKVYFSTGKVPVGEEKKSEFSRRKINKDGEKDFDCGRRKLEFDDKIKQFELISKIGNSLEKIVVDADAKLRYDIDEFLKGFQDSFNEKIVIEVKEILGDLINRLSKNDFDLVLELPANNLDFGFDATELMAAVSGGAREENRNYLRDDDGILASLKRGIGLLFDADWGKTEYSVQVYIVDFDIIDKSIRSKFKVVMDHYSSRISDEIETRLKENIDKFFGKFKEQIENVRGDLLQAQQDQQRSGEEQEALSTALQRIKKKSRDCHVDSKGLHEEVNKLKLNKKQEN